MVLFLLSVKADDVQYDLAGLLHAFQRNVFHLAVEVMSTCEDVRTRKSHERKVCTVCTATDRLYFRGDALHLHCLHGFLHDVVVRFDFLAHIVILMLHVKDSSALSIFLVDEIHAFLHICLLLLVEGHVMVADDV